MNHDLLLILLQITYYLYLRWRRISCPGRRSGPGTGPCWRNRSCGTRSSRRGRGPARRSGRTSRSWRRSGSRSGGGRTRSGRRGRSTCCPTWQTRRETSRRSSGKRRKSSNFIICIYYYSFFVTFRERCFHELLLVQIVVILEKHGLHSLQSHKKP